MTENFSKRKKTYKPRKQSLKEHEPKRPTPRHIIIKMQKIKYKEHILKAVREKNLVTYKGVPIRLSDDFSTETAGQKRLAKNFQIFKMMKSEDLQPR